MPNLLLLLLSRADTAEEDNPEKKAENIKGKGKTIRIATLNVGSMTVREQEVVEFMERRKVNIMCVQEKK